MTINLSKDEYVSSKFDSKLAEELYESTLDSNEDASLGESESFGWYALFRDERAILAVNSQGFVSVSEYETVGAAQIAWDAIETEYDNFTLRGIVEALDTSACDELFLIIDTAQHANRLPSLDDLSEHIHSHRECHDRNAWVLDY